MKIEELKEGGHAQVSKLLESLWKEWGFNYSLKNMRSYLVKGYKWMIKEDKFFVIKDKKKVIGVTSFVIFEGGLADINDLVIKKNERNKGYGTQLLNFVINYVKKKGIRKLIALVNNTKAKEFYEKKGFKEEGLLKDHFRDGEDLFFMSLKFKREKQVGLKDELEQIEVKEKTEEKLLHLPIK